MKGNYIYLALTYLSHDKNNSSACVNTALVKQTGHWPHMFDHSTLGHAVNREAVLNTASSHVGLISVDRK